MITQAIPKDGQRRQQKGNRVDGKPRAEGSALDAQMTGGRPLKWTLVKLLWIEQVPYHKCVEKKHSPDQHGTSAQEATA